MWFMRSSRVRVDYFHPTTPLNLSPSLLLISRNSIFYHDYLLLHHGGKRRTKNIWSSYDATKQHSAFLTPFHKINRIRLHKSRKSKKKKSIAVPLLLLHLPVSSFQILSQRKRSFSFHLVSYGTWSLPYFWFKIKIKFREIRKLKTLNFIIFSLQDCIGFDWDRVDFLHSSFYGAVLWNSW